MLDQDAVFDDPDLGAIAALPDHHDAVDGLTPGQKLGLGDHEPTASAPDLLPTLAPPLLLGFEPGRALDALNAALVVLARLPHPHDGVRRVVGSVFFEFATRSAAPAPAASPARRRGTFTVAVVVVAFGVPVGNLTGIGPCKIRIGRDPGLCGRFIASALAFAPATAPAASPVAVAICLSVGFSPTRAGRRDIRRLNDLIDLCSRALRAARASRCRVGGRRLEEHGRNGGGDRMGRLAGSASGSSGAAARDGTEFGGGIGRT